jgi:transposase
MSRPAPKIQLTSEFIQKAKAELARRETSQGRAQRLRIILMANDGKSGKAIATELSMRPNTVSRWLRRFAQNPSVSLEDAPRCGKPRKYADDFRKDVLALLETPPPKGLATWDGPSVAKELKVSPHAVWRFLREEGICLRRQRSWCVSTDPEFVAKAADVVGLYLDPPCNAIVLSVDEKPSIQALERRHGFVDSSNGKVVRGYNSTYKRHGSLTLFAALQIATGQVVGRTKTSKTREDFRSFIDEVVKGLPTEQEIHVIMDNLSTHKNNEGWLKTYGNRVHFHYTPTSASWLNLVEVFFGLLTRESLRGMSFQDTTQLRGQIESYIQRHNQSGRVFRWRKREVRGTQIRNTIANLRK